MHLSVIIPAYNEERRLPKTLREIGKYLSRQNYPSTGSGQANYEILVVNDGSKDRTAEIVSGLTYDVKHLRLIDNKDNNGKGYVVRQGMLEAKGKYRVFTDADNSTPINQIEKMWPYLKGTCPEPVEGYDIVIGSRDIKGSILDPPQSAFRRFTGETFGFFTNLIVGTWGLADTQCGLKGFTEKAAKDIFPRCKINRFAFDPEILAIGKKFKYKIKEIPVYWKNDPESKVKFKSMIEMGLDLFKIRWNIITGKYQ